MTRLPPGLPHESAPSRGTVRVLYIGGSGRSGSTLLDRLLGQTPGFCSVGEIVHIWRRGLLGDQLCGCGVPFHRCPFWSRVGEEAFGGWDAIDPEELLRLQHRVDRNRYIPLMIAAWVSPSYRRALERYTEYLTRLYRGIQAVSGAGVIVDSAKHASYAFLLRRVSAVDLRVVHLVRDPRGVAHSWTKQVEKPEVVGQTEYMPRYHPARMALRWIAYNLLFHVLRWLGTPSVFLRYESLVAHPRRETDRILQFLGEDPTDERLGFIEDGYVNLEPTHTVAGNPMRFKQGRIALRLDDEWRERMDPRQQRLVWALTRPLGRRYGYPLPRGPATIATSQFAEWPLVTAIIPTRDRPELLKRAVDAVLRQDYPGEIECIVVFDQQAPALPAVDVPERRVLRAVQNERSPGLAGARNSGVLAASGGLVGFCDDDDEWLRDKLTLQVAAFLGHPEASAATCGISVVTGTRTVDRIPTEEIIDQHDVTRSRRMEIHSSTLMMERARFLGDIGMIDEAIPGSYGEDSDWILRAVASGPLIAVRQPLVRVHWQTSYFSDRWQTMIPALLYLLEKHPELAQEPRNLSRMYGRLAFAHAAIGDRPQARSWANRSIDLDRRQPRGYLSYLVTFGLSPRIVQRVVNAAGRGI